MIREQKKSEDIFAEASYKKITEDDISNTFFHKEQKYCDEIDEGKLWAAVNLRKR